MKGEIQACGCGGMCVRDDTDYKGADNEQSVRP